MKAPYFLERCILFIIRGTTEMLNNAASGGHGSIRQGNLLLRGFSIGSDDVVPINVSPLQVFSGLESVWLSLRLMRGLPSDVIVCESDKLGAGMAAVIRYE